MTSREACEGRARDSRPAAGRRRATGPEGGLRAALGAGLLVLLPATAAGWQQATSGGSSPQPLHVAGSNCTQVTVNAACSADVPFDACDAALEAALAAWTQSCSYFRFTTTATSACCRAEYLERGGNTNCIVWEESVWPSAFTADQIAVTTTTYRRSDGTLLDADTTMNGVDYRFDAACAPGLMDIRNTMTHEAGHMLGLDHSTVPGATMEPHAAPAECSQRDLAADDIQGVCTIYPVANDPGTCLGPQGGLNLACVPAAGGAGGCRAAGGRSWFGGAPLVAAVVLGLALRLRRRRLPVSSR